MCFEPFTPFHLVTGFSVRADILVYSSGQYTALFLIVALLRRSPIHQVSAAGLGLMPKYLLHSCIRLLHHLVDSHEGSGPAGSRLTMEMKPDVFLRLSRKIYECIDHFSGRPAMIGTCQAQIVHAFSLHQSPLCFPLLHSKFLTVHRPVILCRVCRYSCACQAG